MEACTEILKSEFASIDDDILEYINGVLKSYEDNVEEEDYIYSSIGDILLSIEPDKTEMEVRSVCKTLNTILKSKISIKSVKKGEDLVRSKEREHSTIVKEAIAHGNPQPISTEYKFKSGNSRKSKRKQNDTKASRYGTAELTVNQRPRIRLKHVYANERQGKNFNIKDIHLDPFDIYFGKKELIMDSEFSLEFGRKYGFVGRNGLGKTVMLKCMSEGKLKLPDHLSCMHVEQEVAADKRSVLQVVLESHTVRQELLQKEKQFTAMLEEGDDVSSALTDVFEQLDLIESDSAPARASTILSGLGFTPEMQERETATFSGGLRMRVALAQALFCKPDLLLLDEPTNMLDMQAVIWLESHLQSWPSTLLIVSHDWGFLDNVATDILHLHNKTIHSFRGNYTQYYEAASDLDNMKYREQCEQFVKESSFKYEKKLNEKAEKMRKMLINMPVLETSEVRIDFQDVEHLKGDLIRLSDVSFTYPGNSKPVLSNIDISIAMETKVCFVGKNGSGKTTLINLILDRLTPSGGHRSAHKHLRVGYFTQHFVDQLDMSVCAVELMEREIPGYKIEEYRKMLGRFGLGGPPAMQKIESLSGGQKARVALALIAGKEPNCLVLDEPTNHLDMDTVAALGDALFKFNGGVVLVSHDERLLGKVCQELWVCNKGTVKVERGGIKEYRRQVERMLQL